MVLNNDFLPQTNLPNNDKVGLVLRSLRKSRHITIQELAKLLNRSTGYISQLERGISQPTLKDLYAACTVFSVPMTWFIEAEPASPEMDLERQYVVRAHQRKYLSLEGAITELLTPEPDPKIEFMISTYEPGLETELKDVRTEGAEYGIVLEGTLELWVDENLFTLHKGDSYRFSRTSTYRSRNPSDANITKILWFGIYKIA